MISTLLDQNGEEIKILEELIVMVGYTRNQNIGKIWLSLFFKVDGIFAGNIQIANIVEQFMEPIYQEFTHFSIYLKN